VDLGSAQLTTQRLDPGRRLSRVGDTQFEALAMQVACGREPGTSEAEYQRPGAGFERCKILGMRVHRSFSVASPISTRITVMIQKRTITFGSAQPLSS
jgi:hypothetical protein